MTSPERAMPGARLWSDFVGSWELVRDITHADATRARFSGTAVFRPVETGLDYTEAGLLKVGNAAPMTASQRYHWDRDLTVWFDDGRLFHHVPAFGGAVEHWCDPDTYVGNYDFSDWPAFSIRWDVRGPRKAYQSVSRFVRIGAE